MCYVAFCAEVCLDLIHLAERLFFCVRSILYFFYFLYFFMCDKGKLRCSKTLFIPKVRRVFFFEDGWTFFRDGVAVCLGIYNGGYLFCDIFY